MIARGSHRVMNNMVATVQWLSTPRARRPPRAQPVNDHRHHGRRHAAGLCGRPVSRGQALSMKNRLRVLRAEREWSQAALADRLDVSRQTVNAIETGKYDPSLPLAFTIARLFKRNIEDIFEPEE